MHGWDRSREGERWINLSQLPSCSGCGCGCGCGCGVRPPLPIRTSLPLSPSHHFPPLPLPPLVNTTQPSSPIGLLPSCNSHHRIGAFDPIPAHVSTFHTLQSNRNDAHIGCSLCTVQPHHRQHCILCTWALWALWEALLPVLHLQLGTSHSAVFLAPHHHHLQQAVCLVHHRGSGLLAWWRSATALPLAAWDAIPLLPPDCTVCLAVLFGEGATPLSQNTATTSGGRRGKPPAKPK